MLSILPGFRSATFPLISSYENMDIFKINVTSLNWERIFKKKKRLYGGNYLLVSY